LSARTARLFDIWQYRQRAILGPERDIVIGFRHDGGLARDRIPQDRKAVAGADHEGEKSVEVFEAGRQRVPQARALAHPPCQVTRRDLGIVLGRKRHALAPQRAADGIVV
jgi:hypothetical protein